MRDSLNGAFLPTTAKWYINEMATEGVMTIEKFFDNDDITDITPINLAVVYHICGLEFAIWCIRSMGNNDEGDLIAKLRKLVYDVDTRIYLLHRFQTAPLGAVAPTSDALENER